MNDQDTEVSSHNKCRIPHSFKGSGMKGMILLFMIHFIPLLNHSVLSEQSCIKHLPYSDFLIMKAALVSPEDLMNTHCLILLRRQALSPSLMAMVVFRSALLIVPSGLILS
jgi:hypothetical protein